MVIDAFILTGLIRCGRNETSVLISRLRKYNPIYGGKNLCWLISLQSTFSPIAPLAWSVCQRPLLPGLKLHRLLI